MAMIAIAAASLLLGSCAGVAVNVDAGSVSRRFDGIGGLRCVRIAPRDTALSRGCWRRGCAVCATAPPRPLCCVAAVGAAPRPDCL
jgi:hypothetical protein